MNNQTIKHLDNELSEKIQNNNISLEEKKKKFIVRYLERGASDYEALIETLTIDMVYLTNFIFDYDKDRTDKMCI